jgi:endonuclease III
MTLGSTQLLTEMSTRNLLRGKGLLTRKAENLTAICEPIIQKM